MLLQKIMNKVRYLLRDKDFKSDIVITDISCEILYTNAFDEYDNVGISYKLSSIYALYRFINNESLSASFNHFCNTLNMYGFRYIIYDNDGEILLIVEGSLADYDELIALYYDEDLSANEDPFISKTISQLRFLPSDYFTNVKYLEEWEKSYLNFNYYGGNCYKSIVRSNVEPDLVTLVEKDTIILDFDHDEELDDLKNSSIECIYLAVRYDDKYLISEINTLISFGESHHITKARNGEYVAIIKIRKQPLLQYMNIYDDSDICLAIGDIKELEIEYVINKEEKNNDDYYKNIDEIIEV